MVIGFGCMLSAFGVEGPLWARLCLFGFGVLALVQPGSEPPAQRTGS
jgi:hypothetical protein